MKPLQVELLVAGTCTHPEHIVHRNWKWKPLVFPATVALIRHPEEGVILFDSGYSEPFLAATRHFPERMYRWVTPVQFESGHSVAAQLAQRGISPLEVRWIVVSHFHADHIGGLRDFPHARFLFLDAAWRRVQGLRGLGGLRRGFLPSLLPEDFSRRATAVQPADVQLPAELRGFTGAVDLFGDGSLLGIPLEGHAEGQMGLALRTEAGELWFLVADACWTRRCLEGPIAPHWVTRLLFDDSAKYRDQLGKLAGIARRADGLRIIPSHCMETIAELT
ncbi:MAG: MBL fold metallo-hydrolase [Planctomycetota bacterium]